MVVTELTNLTHADPKFIPGSAGITYPSVQALGVLLMVTPILTSITAGSHKETMTPSTFNYPIEDFRSICSMLLLLLNPR